jgi:molybdopterin molybdotransferase
MLRLFCKIRDSNRAALIAALEEEGIAVLDLGIVPDNKELIRDRMLRASAECDVVIASGGVSMGDKDFVKPLLEELGTVSAIPHYGLDNRYHNNAYFAY